MSKMEHFFQLCSQIPLQKRFWVLFRSLIFMVQYKGWMDRVFRGRFQMGNVNFSVSVSCANKYEQTFLHFYPPKLQMCFHLRDLAEFPQKSSHSIKPPSFLHGYLHIFHYQCQGRLNLNSII